MIQYEIKPDINCLIEACKTLNLNLIKIIPTSDCINAILLSCSLKNGKNKQCVIAELVANIIDIYKLLEKGCYINNIDRFDIKFDNKFIEKCTMIGYYPYQNIYIKPTMQCLYIECKKCNNVQNIKKLISTGLKPDIKWLIEACDNISNIQNIKYLIETHKITPSMY